MIKYQKWISKHCEKSLKNETIFITGGNSGIGFEATRNFVYLGASIIWGCRNLKKAEEAKAKIVNEFALANIQIIQVDLADTNSIENCVKKLIENNTKIDVIYNNAGVFRIPRGKTMQNFDLVVGTNLVGTFVLNKLLLNHYKDSQFIFTTSITAMFAKLNLEDPFFETTKYGNFKAYGRSKFGLNQLVSYWSENLDTHFALIHPGITYTPLIKKAYKSRIFSTLAAGFMKTFFHTSEKASLTALLAVENSKKFAYYGPRGLFAFSGYPKERKFMKRYLKGNKNTFELLEGLKY